MAALAAATQRKWKNIFSFVQNYIVLNASTIYVGSFVGGLNGTSTAQRGYAQPFKDSNLIKYLGYCFGSPFDLSTTLTVVGNTSASRVPQVSVEAGPGILQGATVTGVAAVTDQFRYVYLRNDNDLNVTQVLSGRVGRIEYWSSGTTVDVLMFGNIARDCAGL